MTRVLKIVVPALAVLVTAVVAVAATGSSGAHAKVGRVSALFSFDAGHGAPDEGAVSYVVLSRDPGGPILSAELRGDLDARAITTPAPAGQYTLSAYQRVCDANCGNLDAPSYQCSRAVRVRPGQRVRAQIRVRWQVASTATPPRCHVALR